MNQIELSPFFQRKEIVNECLKHNIAIESYSPLGKGAFVDLPELKKISDVSVDVCERGRKFIAS
jgi:2,5-diketo-D-gluconate reductase A